LPDAVAIAGAKQGVDFLRDAMLRRVPANDSVFVTGIRRAVSTMARSHAAKADAGAMVTLIETVPRANERIALGLLDAIATSWPEETPPAFTDAQRATLRTAAAGASAPLAEAYGKVAARWGITDIFTGAR